MNARTTLPALLTVPLLVACSATTIESSRVDEEGVYYASLASLSEMVDTDGDEVDDRTIYFLSVMITDQEDFCDSVDSSLLDGFDNGTFLTMDLVSTNEPWTLDGISHNATLFDATLGAGGTMVAGSLIIREGGVTTTNLANRQSTGFGSEHAFLDPASIGAGLDVGPANMRGTLTMDMSLDLSDPAAFDADNSEDGTNDHTAVNEVIEARYAPAKNCPNYRDARDAQGAS